MQITDARLLMDSRFQIHSDDKGGVRLPRRLFAPHPRGMPPCPVCATPGGAWHKDGCEARQLSGDTVTVVACGNTGAGKSTHLARVTWEMFRLLGRQRDPDGNPTCMLMIHDATRLMVRNRKAKCMYAVPGTEEMNLEDFLKLSETPQSVVIHGRAVDVAFEAIRTAERMDCDVILVCDELDQLMYHKEYQREDYHPEKWNLEGWSPARLIMMYHRHLRVHLIGGFRRPKDVHPAVRNGATSFRIFYTSGPDNLEWLRSAFNKPDRPAAEEQIRSLQPGYNGQYLEIEGTE